MLVPVSRVSRVAIVSLLENRMENGGGQMYSKGVLGFLVEVVSAFSGASDLITLSHIIHDWYEPDEVIRVDTQSSWIASGAKQQILEAFGQAGEAGECDDSTVVAGSGIFTDNEWISQRSSISSLGSRWGWCQSSLAPLWAASPCLEKRWEQSIVPLISKSGQAVVEDWIYWQN